jgi:hypothetical protein
MWLLTPTVLPSTREETMQELDEVMNALRHPPMAMDHPGRRTLWMERGIELLGLPINNAGIIFRDLYARKIRELRDVLIQMKQKHTRMQPYDEELEQCLTLYDNIQGIDGY